VSRRSAPAPHLPASRGVENSFKAGLIRAADLSNALVWRWTAVLNPSGCDLPRSRMRHKLLDCWAIWRWMACPELQVFAFADTMAAHRSGGRPWHCKSTA